MKMENNSENKGGSILDDAIESIKNNKIENNETISKEAIEPIKTDKDVEFEEKPQIPITAEKEIEEDDAAECYGDDVEGIDSANISNLSKENNVPRNTSKEIVSEALFDKLENKIKEVCNNFKINNFNFKNLVLKDYDATINFKYGEAWGKSPISEKMGDYREKIGRYEFSDTSSFDLKIKLNVSETLNNSSIKKQSIDSLFNIFKNSNHINNGKFTPSFKLNPNTVFSENDIKDEISDSKFYKNYKNQPMLISESDKYWICVSECSTCNGTGEVFCSSCNGHGKLRCGTCNGSGKIVCRKCGGSKRLKCWSCRGKGEHRKEGSSNSIELVPAGVDRRTVQHYSGMYRWVEIKKCNECYGRGYIDCNKCGPDGYETCPNCDGTGEVTCKDCGGSGKLQCESCNGTGRFSEIQGYYIARYLDVSYPKFDNKEVETAFNKRSLWNKTLSGSIDDITINEKYESFSIKRKIPYIKFDLELNKAGEIKIYHCKCVGNSIDLLEGFDLSKDELNLTKLLSYGKDFFSSITVCKENSILKNFAQNILLGNPTTDFENYFSTKDEMNEVANAIKTMHLGLSEIAINDISYRHSFVSAIIYPLFRKMIEENQRLSIEAFGVLLSTKFKKTTKNIILKSYLKIILFIALVAGIYMSKVYEPWFYPFLVIILVLSITTHLVGKFRYLCFRDIALKEDTKKVKILKIAYLATLSPLDTNADNKKILELFSMISSDKNILMNGLKYASKATPDKILSKIIALKEISMKQIYFRGLVNNTIKLSHGKMSSIQESIAKDFNERYENLNKGKDEHK